MANDKIFVDLDEEIVFTVEKILTASSSRVIVVIPESANLVASLVSLKLLSRQIAKSQKLIVVVTEDKLGLTLSRRAGLIAKAKISNITPQVWVEAEKLKNEFLEKRKQLRDKLIGERHESSDYSIVEEEVEPDSVEEKEEESTSAEVEEEDSGEEEEVEYVPPMGPKPRLDPKIVNLGIIKVVSGGDITKYQGLEDEVRGLVVPESEEENNGDGKPSENKEVSKEKEGVDQEEKVDGSTSDKDEDVIKNTNDSKKEEEIKKKQEERRRMIGRDMANVGASPVRTRERQSRGRMKKDNVKSMQLSSYLGTVKRFYSGKNAKYKIGVTAFAGLLLLYFFITTFLSNAAVAVTVEKASIDTAEASITGKTSLSEVGLEAMELPVKPISLEDEVSSSADTTGTLQDGENAQGLVTLYNKTESEISLPAGTVITNITNELSYTLLTAANVPAAVVDGGGNVNVGVKKDVSVEANSFGEKYNTTDAVVTFKVEGYTTDELSAKSFNDISGGTTSDESAVDEKDIQNLRDGLVEELKNSLKEKLQGQVADGEVLIESSIQYSDPVVNSDKEAGAKGDAVTVTVSLEATGYAVLESDLRFLAAEVIKQNSEFDGAVNVDDLAVPTISNVSVDDDVITFDIQTGGEITANVSEEELQNELAGKSIDEARDYLNSIQGVTDYTVEAGVFFLPDSFKKFPEAADIDVTINVAD